jgi:hypothetical protein
MACGASDRCDGVRRVTDALRHVALVLAGAVLAGCGSPYYTADPIEAWVVDAETGKPIEGAVVVAHWQLRGFSLDSQTRRNQLEVIETASDRDGRFFVPGFTKLNLTLERLREEDPKIVIFKPGFSIAGGQSHYSSADPEPGAHRSSSLNGKRFQVRQLDRHSDQYVRDLRGVAATMNDLSVSGDLGRTPRLVAAMVCEKRRLKAEESKQVLLDVPGEVAVEVRCEPQ